MHWEDPFSTGCKLNLSHVVIGTADTIPSIRRHLIIQYRTAIAAQFNGTADAVWMKTVTQQSNHHVGVGQLRHTLCVYIAITTQNGRGKGWMQGRHFKLVADRPRRAIKPLEMVAINRLRGTVKGIDRLRKLRGRKVR